MLAKVLGIEPRSVSLELTVLPLNYTNLFGAAGGIRTHTYWVEASRAWPLNTTAAFCLYICYQFDNFCIYICSIFLVGSLGIEPSLR